MHNIFSYAKTLLLSLPLLLVSQQLAAVCTAGNPLANTYEDTPDSAFSTLVVAIDATALHDLTGLTWDRCSLGQIFSGGSCTGSATTHTWQDAMAQVAIKNAANYLGYSDWRLSNVEELLSIAETCGYSPVINQNVFPATQSDWYWSSSSYAGSLPHVWVVNFYIGSSSSSHESVGDYVRLVRGGQSFDSFDLLDPCQDRDKDGIPNDLDDTPNEQNPNDCVGTPATLSGDVITGTQVSCRDPDSVITDVAGIVVETDAVLAIMAPNVTLDQGFSAQAGSTVNVVTEPVCFGD